MSVTYTNRKGKTYFLHQGQTPKGNPRYFFALRDDGDLVEALPPGYEIYENPNGQVFLRKLRSQIITAAEVATVEAGMQQVSSLERYIIDVKRDTIAIHTPDQDADRLADILGIFPGASRSQVQDAVERSLSYSPLLRFVLVDREKRLFEAHRYNFRGAIDDWISIGGPQDLATLVATFVQHLGKESFYELY